MRGLFGRRRKVRKWGVLTTLAFGVYVNGSFELVSLRVIERESKKVAFRYSFLKTVPETRVTANCLARHWKTALVKRRIAAWQFAASESAQ